METKFRITFNPNSFGEGFFLKNRADLIVILDAWTVQDAKELLETQGIDVKSIQRL
jgi:hypothetical protein